MHFPLPPVELAFVIGVISGFILALPVGPINLTIINEAGRSGFLKGLVIGFGATLMELVYVGIAFTGLASFVVDPFVMSLLELCSFVFLIYLGIRFLGLKSILNAVELGKTDRALDKKWRNRVETRWTPHSAFGMGVIRVFANPALLVFWVVVATNFLGRGWIDPEHKFTIVACIAGVGLGTQLWYAFLSWLVSIRHKSLSEPAMLRLARMTGVILLVLALVHGVSLAWSIARHRMHQRFQLRPRTELKTPIFPSGGMVEDWNKDGNMKDSNDSRV